MTRELLAAWRGLPAAGADLDADEDELLDDSGVYAEEDK